MRSRALIVLCLISILILSACGGSGAKSQPSIPIFTSTPVTAAAQGMPYAYTVTATDPAGGSVTFALTMFPSSASLSGSAITWTPSAAQSRTSNSFVVTATTTSGGSATQSWTVTPAGTVTVNWTNTLWTATGTVTHAETLPVDAVLLNADGSVSVLPGTETSPGVASIPNVPAGYYWLTMGLDLNGLLNSYWTSTSNFDAGRDVAGSSTVLSKSSQTTTFDFNLSGLDGASPANNVSFMTDNFLLTPIVLQPTAGSSTLSTAFATTTSPDNQVDWSQVNSGFLLQYEPAVLDTFNLLTLGPAQTLTGLSLTGGAANAITATLQPGPSASLNISVPGSQWAPLFNNAGPSPATPVSSWLSVSAQPYVTGVNTSLNLFGPNLYLALPTVVAGLGNGSSWLGGACVFNGLLPLPTNQPPVLTDQNLGTLQYGDPFPSAWTRSLSLCQEGSVLIPVSGALTAYVPFFYVDGAAVVPSNSPIAPVVSQVQNPTVNGVNAFTVATLNSTSVTLNWSAPAAGAPYGYLIIPFTVTPITNGVLFASAGTFGTAKTSVTLPPLTAGQTYIFVIVAVADGKANMESSPNRSMLPTGFTSVVSAPITISAGAATPAIHGDASLIRRLSRPSPAQMQRGQKATR